MYRTIFEWAMKNKNGELAAPLARFFDEAGHDCNNDNCWKLADMWMCANAPNLGLEFADAAQQYSDWLKEATTNRW